MRDSTYLRQARDFIFVSIVFKRKSSCRLPLAIFTPITAAPERRTPHILDTKKPVIRPALFVAGDEGFEPPITGPEPVALPLGQSPLACIIITYLGFESDSTHLRWARNFISENKFSRESFPAKCHRHFSPRSRDQPHLRRARNFYHEGIAFR